MIIENAKYKDNPLIFLDCTKETDGVYDFPCMFLLIGDTIMNIVFRNAYMTGTNEGTINATTTAGTTASLISSYDLVVNNYVVTRKRYKNPGVARDTAFADARNLLTSIYTKLRKALVEDESSISYTTLSVFPESGKDATVTNLKNSSSSSSFVSAVTNAINSIK